MYVSKKLVLFALGALMMPHSAAAQADSDVIELHDPRVSRYTAISALRIGDAQAEEDESLQAEALALTSMLTSNF